ncbi:RecQ family ATP-dependent DNA helicase [Aeromicrobium sp. NPDC092404]|uniref:RecQ family ATP-dependent DNA helicase n=1 Tax=Aeromicrobium sp. NPDC092404 TaxID=3154976 RepID=UPI0034150968
MPAPDVSAVARDLLEPHARLRPGQRDAMEAVLEHDTLAVLATGTGKTLIYQVAAELIDGPTLVVSPTIALQADQLAALRASGATAETLNSTRRPAQRRRALEAFGARRLEFLLLAPEQLTRPDVVAVLAEAGIGLFVVDEAHCVSMWGEDFRPDYLALAAVIGTLGRPRVLALTATASPATRERICDALGLTDPVVVVGGADRAEIWLGARQVATEDDVTHELAELLRPLADEQQTAIVYAATRRRTEELVERLRAEGLEPVAYHGGLATRERTQVHRGFRDGSTRLVVATSAFGLGVDRADVRLVVHADPPERLDDYWQEVGRAGRDGEAARGILFTHPTAYGVRRYFAAGTGTDAADLSALLMVLRSAEGPVRPGDLARAADLSTARSRRAVNVLLRSGAILESRAGILLRDDTPPGELVDQAVALADGLKAERETGVELIRRYAETADCRRRLVLELLGEAHPQPCGACDNCDAGRSSPAIDRPYPLGADVRHDEWGLGTVSQYEGDRVVVLFESGGYRTLSLDAVRERDLLEPA